MNDKASTNQKPEASDITESHPIKISIKQRKTVSKPKENKPKPIKDDNKEVVGAVSAASPKLSASLMDLDLTKMQMELNEEKPVIKKSNSNLNV